MEWLFSISFDRKMLTLKAKLIYHTDQIERIRIIGRNRSITLQNNRPFLEARGLKHKRIEWKLIEGKMNNAHLLQNIIHTIESFLKGKERFYHK
jgi:hypothetical protein